MSIGRVEYAAIDDDDALERPRGMLRGRRHPAGDRIRARAAGAKRYAQAHPGKHILIGLIGPRRQGHADAATHLLAERSVMRPTR